MEQQNFPVKPMEFFEVMDKVRKGWHNFLPNQSLKKSYFGILMFIRRICRIHPEQGGARVSDLAHSMNQTMASISQKINALEQEELVERIVSKEDRRVCFIRLSKKGEDLVNDTLAGFDTQVMMILNQLGAEKSVQLMYLLKELGDILQESNPPHSCEQEGGCHF